MPLSTPQPIVSVFIEPGSEGGSGSTAGGSGFAAFSVSDDFFTLGIEPKLPAEKSFSANLIFAEISCTFLHDVGEGESTHTHLTALKLFIINTENWETAPHIVVTVTVSV